VTFDTPQSRSLLAGEDVDFIPFIGAREPMRALRSLPEARRLLDRHAVDTVISTGAAPAVPFIVAARAKRIECHYIESAARSDGPSLSGRLIARMPGVALYTQYPAWADERWQYRGSVFDSFAPSPGVAREAAALRRVVVTLGTFRGYGFERLLRRLIEILPSGVEVLWQTGDTDTSRLPIDGRESMPDRALAEAMRAADVVVAHAGVGTAIAALEAGRCPVLVPRRVSFSEHVDDHQTQIARELARRGLAVSGDADQLSLDHLLQAAATGIAPLGEEPPLRMEERQ
jgi:UDP-N-acetylglucosamine:LPS N-acetylglucosamine transferase